MALIAAIQGAAAIGGSLQGIFDPKDAERRQKTDEAYNRAIQGDVNALAFLKQRTGEYGEQYVQGYGSIAGWATGEAKTYARVKYDAARAVLATNGQVQNIIDQAAPVVQEAAREAGYEILPQWVVWGAVAVVAYLVLTSKRGA